jgi:hypothetical protein
MKRADYIKKLEGMLTFYSNGSKEEREAWVLECFLELLGIPFKAGDFETDRGEPVDLGFEAGNFQIKELLDEGRKRNDEVMLALEKARQSTAEEVATVSRFEPEFLTVPQLAKRLAPEMVTKIERYYGCNADTTDLLFYANLQCIFIEDAAFKPIDIELPPALFAWRSVSITSGTKAAVLFASADAPAFLQGTIGKVYSRVG